MEICHTAFLLKMACSSEMRQNGEMVTKLQGIFFDPKVRHGGSPRSNSVEPSGHLPVLPLRRCPCVFGKGLEITRPGISNEGIFPGDRTNNDRI
jgi:hypothetical protein